jgi:hypothetical protein
MGTTNQFWVLTKVTDDSDPMWDESTTISGTPETTRALFDLSRGVPHEWRLLKGKTAHRFMRNAIKEELRYGRMQRTRSQN